MRRANPSIESHPVRSPSGGSAARPISGDDALARLRALPRATSTGFRFAFDPHGGPRHHAHPHGQVAFAPADLVTIVVADRLWMTSPLSAVWIPPNWPHEIHAMRGREMCNLYVAPRLAKRLPGAPASLQVSPLLRELLLRLGAEAAGTPPDDRGPFLAAAIAEVGLRLRTANDASAPATVPIDAPRLQPIAAALAADPSDPRQLDDWASELGTSARTLSRAVRAATGLSWRDWRLRLRMIDASRRLATGAQVKAIAHDVGYSNATAFIAAFARIFGTTPGQAERRRPPRT